MDTKLKSSKKFSIGLAVLLVAAAAVGYFSMYPVFERRALPYYVDVLHDEEFLSELYKNSYVLYKELKEPETSWHELYLQIQKEAVQMSDPAYEQARLQAETVMDEILEDWRSRCDVLDKEINFGVIDCVTGESLQNTEDEILLLGTEEADEQLENLYSYYIRLSYDAAGNLEETAVKGMQPDILLKNVQIVMRRNLLGEVYQSLAEPVSVPADAQVPGRPLKNAAFVYALTEEQQQRIITGKSLLDGIVPLYDYEYAYAAGGTQRVFLMFLLLLSVPAFLLPKWKRYCPGGSIKGKLPFEIVAAGLLLIWGPGSFMATKMISCTNHGYFDDIYQQYLSWMGAWMHIGMLRIGSKNVVVSIVNCVWLMLVFGIWYYLVACIGQIHEVGLRTYIRERLLAYRFMKLLARCLAKGKAGLQAIWDGILHIDLGSSTEKQLKRIVGLNFVLIAGMCCLWIFGGTLLLVYSVALYFMMKKYIRHIQAQYQNLLSATRSVAEGNLQTEFTGDWGVFESYKQELGKIQEGLRKAVDEEVKSQRMKTELISNVSHDLRTPLTAMTTYIELLGEEDLTLQQRREYLEILKKKSERLKYLIEDLFEVSKASSGNLVFHPVEVDICSLLRQVYLEYEEKAQQVQLLFRFQMPEEKILLMLDSQRTYRVFENLYLNVIKYALPGTRVYVHVEKQDNGAAVEIKNTSAAELNVTPEELTERFVRGDSARNTEGSGLGLAIARSFVELQGGSMEVDIDGDLFKVMICWRA